MKDIFQSIVDEYDSISLGTGKEISYWVDSGSVALNRIISGDYNKGYPGGRIIEFFGDPSTGKSLLIYIAIANFQKQFGDNACVILDDTEDVFTEQIAKLLGIDTDKVIIINSITVEQHFNTIFKGNKKEGIEGLVPYVLKKNPNAKFLIALDSIAMLSTEHEQEVGFEKDDMTKSKKLRAGIRMVNMDYISKYDILYLATNHTISRIGAYGNAKTTPGGGVVPFMCSVRVELLQGLKLKDKDGRIIGIEAEANIKKNKVAPPFQQTKIEVFFESGVSRYSGVSELLAKDGLVVEKGGWLEDKEGNKFRRGDIDEERMKKLLTSK